MTGDDDIYRRIQLEVGQTVQRFGMDGGLAGEISAAITLRLQKLLGKHTVYFPDPISQEERYAAIRRDFDGKNHNEVCKKHGISRSTLYRAIK